jgi:hypothetical protein
MKRIVRWMFIVAAALSLMVSVAAVAASVLSNFHNCGWGFSRDYAIEGGRGTGFYSCGIGTQAGVGFIKSEELRAPQIPFRRKPGFSFSHGFGPPSPYPFHQGMAMLKFALQPNKNFRDLQWNDYGFISADTVNRGVENYLRIITLPLWLVAAVSATFPAIWVAVGLTNRIHRRRRFLAGFCATCGYDLRASPDLCPECGTMSPKT